LAIYQPQEPAKAVIPTTIILSDEKRDLSGFITSINSATPFVAGASAKPDELTDRRMISMNKTKIAKTLIAALAGSALLSGAAFADESLSQKAQQTSDSAGSKIDSSMKKVDGYMDDSGITAKAKAALVDDEAIKSTDISVKTHQGVVTLSGFVASQDQAEKAVALVQKIEGVKSVSDKLHVKDSKNASLKGYAGDTATTSEIKAKLLADDIVPSRNVKVETTDGVVQLSGNQAQSDRAEKIAKAIEGVKSVKNDLKVKS
jgi:hyperosmotically inducible protein